MSPKHLALLGLCLGAAPLAAQTPAPAPAAPAATPAPAPKLDYDSLAFGRQLTQWFYEGQADSLWAHSDSGIRANLGTKDKWLEAIMQFTGRAGAEALLVEERWVKRNGNRQYWRIINATEFTQEPVMLRWVLLPGRLIGGIGMNPASQAPPVDPN